MGVNYGLKFSPSHVVPPPPSPTPRRFSGAPSTKNPGSALGNIKNIIICNKYKYSERGINTQIDISSTCNQSTTVLTNKQTTNNSPVTLVITPPCYHSNHVFHIHSSIPPSIPVAITISTIMASFIHVS